MPLVEREYALSRLDPYIPLIYKSIHSGVSTYFSDYSEALRSVHCSRTRANIIWDHTYAAALRLFDGMAQVEPREVKSLKLLLIEDEFLLRFKKLCENKVSSNVKTKQIRAFRGQLPLVGFPPVFHLEAGYVFDDMEQRAKDLFIVCPNGKLTYWAECLDRDKPGNVVVDLFAKDAHNDAKATIAPNENNVVKFRRKENEGDPKQ
jgi:hypothetical protein